VKRERIMRIHIDIERVLEVIVLIGVAVHALVGALILEGVIHP